MHVYLRRDAPDRVEGSDGDEAKRKPRHALSCLGVSRSLLGGVGRSRADAQAEAQAHMQTDRQAGKHILFHTHHTHHTHTLLPALEVVPDSVPIERRPCPMPR